MVLSAVVHNPAYDLYAFQPLNGDTTYDVSGQLSGGETSPHAVNAYGVYVAKGKTLGIAATAEGTQPFQVAVIGPGGEGAFYGGGGPKGVTGAVDAKVAGVYTVSIRSAVARKYAIGMVGADLPKLVVGPADATGAFHIAATGQMPTVPFRLTGIARDPIPANWSTNDFAMTYRITYDARSSPHGPDRQYSFAPNVKYIYDYDAPSYPVPFGGPAHGGMLSLTVTPQTPGATKPLTVSDVRIDAINPTPTMVRNFLLAMTPDPAWPAKSSYDYYSTVRKIINHESTIRQFTPAGQPYWSTNGDGGVGLMQLTNPKPTYESIWNWRQNLNLGVGSADFLSGKITTARNRLTKLATAVGVEAAKLGAKAAAITPDMIALEAIRGFNGYDNNLGLIDEWRAVRAPAASSCWTTASPHGSACPHRPGSTPRRRSGGCRIM